MYTTSEAETVQHGSRVFAVLDLYSRSQYRLCDHVAVQVESVNVSSSLLVEPVGQCR